MNSTGNFPSCIQTRDGHSRRCADHGRIRVNLQATHAVMNDWRDDGHIEFLLGDGRPWDDVVVELLARPRLATGLVPRLTTGVGWPGATVRVLLRFLGRLEVL